MAENINRFVKMTKLPSKKVCYALLLLLSSCSVSQGYSMTIAEKKAAYAKQNVSNSPQDDMQVVIQDLKSKRQSLNDAYVDVQQSYIALQTDENADQKTALLQQKREQIVALKNEIDLLHKKWKKLSIESGQQEEDGIWHQPDTTIGQLVIDYGTSEYLYVMPPEVASLKIHVSSQLSIPKSSWDEMLELILAYYGIGIKQPMPFLRELYFLRISQGNITAVLFDKKELEVAPQSNKVLYLLIPSPTELKRVFQFLEKFSPQEQVTMQIMGNAIAIVGYPNELLEILKIYEFASLPKLSQTWKLISLQRGQGDEIAKILYSIFEGGNPRDFAGEASHERSHSFSNEGQSSFKVIVLKHPSQSLFLIGQPDQVEKATQIIQEIEERIGEVQEKSVWWYACKHSEAQDLASVLNAVYNRMVSAPEAFSLQAPKRKKSQKNAQSQTEMTSLHPIPDPDGGFDNLVVQTPKITFDETTKKKQFENNENFIVDPKTNSIVMVVESYVLPKLKELVKKLDVQKKMVQIEILLFEKKISDNNSFGLNVLKLGQAAARYHSPRLLWNDLSGRKDKHRDRFIGERGILRFTYSRNSHNGFPAYDIAYSFLLTQEDIQINACPTITAVNQTSAKIAVVDQISINTGIVEIDTTKATRLKDAYVREEYGVIINITPTIHAKLDDDEDPEAPKYVTLAADICFDTTKPSKDDRPDVTRRNIKNEICVADGETIIIGGLRKKMAHENQETVPFLGEIPGVGKLFSNTHYTDTTTEMFIFITPKIIPDQTEEYRKLRQQDLAKRPGDLPEFLKEVMQAKKVEKQKLFERGMQLLLGRPEDVQPTPRDL